MQEKLEPGINPRDEINVVIGILKDGNLKNEENGEIPVGVVLFPAMIYPINYGFIPQTREGSSLFSLPYMDCNRNKIGCS